ncbi:hypothetical protein [Neoroseomonas rubea]|uniref:hypothetical protein n=1 Tax=Neoroseomonas rubea TaxID=2748666 RepID=UPI0018DEF896|nr:hypothetical protein [Roseomonas rubea]
MPEPMDKPQFDALLARHGIPLTEAEREGIRAVSGHILAFAERVRTTREVGAEMAVTFDAKGAAR